MNRLRQSGIDFSVGTLNFLANIGIMLPYVLILTKYQTTHSETFLIALVAFYISRAASIFYTKRLNLRSTTYLILSLVLGALGSLTFALTDAVGWLIIGSLLWGYSAATIWPYFLTVKLHLSATTEFRMKRLYWAIFAGLALVIGVDLLAKLSYTLTFVLLALLYLAAVPGGILLDNFTNDFYQNRPHHLHGITQTWRWILSVIGFAVIAVLTTLRKASVSIPSGIVLAIIGVALVILAIELYSDRHVLPNYKVRLLNRGFLVSLVLLFNSFFAYFYLGSGGMYAVFALYLVGFETGYPVFKALGKHDEARALRLSQISLVAGHVLLLVPWVGSYPVGLLLITLYVGYDNPTINETLYGSAEIDSDTAIVNKYRFSTYGGLLCQLAMFGLLVAVSAVTHTHILDFFKPSNAGNFWLYTLTMSWPLVLISLGISIGNILHEPKTRDVTRSVD
ncbi:hypothetical protein [Levilactobacillus fujinensis]|uniref:Integral membrane protein n=1 Tax=Levilactobacillus fujinensis TaxID=2486024 RepID=A0ABW1TG48_9LACO|nr:hypothetical protein [Levilactobacillus fujinensis]